MQNNSRNQLVLAAFLFGALGVVFVFARSVRAAKEIVTGITSLSLIVLLVACIGGLLVALDYARKGLRFRAGLFIGLFLGASISLVALGLFAIAAGQATSMINDTLFGIACTGTGALLLWILKTFPPSNRIGSPNKALTIPDLRAVLPKVRLPAPPSKETTPDRPPRTSRVFISYRREDSPDVTGRIYDRLIQTYGKDCVFKDIDSIPFGVDFRTYLNGVIEKCDVVLVVIGAHWLTIIDAEGKSRLEDKRDFVRMELESALERNIPVIPLLVQGASMPAEEALPDSLKAFAYRNGTQVRHDPDFHNDMDRLIKSLEQALT